jgi:hypothetical protein
VARDANGGFQAGAVGLAGKLTQTSNDGLVSSGTVGQGSIPAEGAGTRMMWYPGKAAFRAGGVDGTRWDDANVGIISTATGAGTTASGFNSTAMGNGTTASGIISTAIGNGTRASGERSTAMGVETTASGNFSTAIGYRAGTNGQTGAFVYGDNSTFNNIDATQPNQFVVRAAGGTIFFSSAGLGTGVSLVPGTSSWASVSDRNKKENFRPVDGEEILSRVVSLPITNWNYIGGDPNRRFVGPTAQDFQAAFGLGEETTITTQDMDGVTLTAVQELGKENETLKEEVTKLKEEYRSSQEEEVSKERLEKLEKRLEELEKTLEE